MSPRTKERKRKTMSANILVVDDEKSIRVTFQSFLAGAGYQVATASDYNDALGKIQEAAPDLIFADILLGGKTGIDLLEKVKKMDVHIPVVMITGAPNLETASKAIRLGAFDYISKPVEKDLLLDAALRALRFKRVVDENTRIRSNLEAIFRSVKDGIIMVDTELRIVEMNGAAARICGVSRKAAIGQSFASMPALCEGKVLEMLQWTIKKQEPIEFPRLECRCPDHPAQVISLSASPLVKQESKFSGAVLVLRDVTSLAALGKNLNDRRQFYHIIGQNAKMQKIYSLIENLADFQTTVLITGESGTGKELVAETLHHIGPRSQGPLVKVNCAALSESLLESELFGHVKGAFTGAVSDKIGRFQKANGGTIFLDEIGDISPKMQLNLLRVLQEMEFERVGDSTPIRINVRVIAATNRNLGERVHLGEFREDLYYRLNVIEIPIPPLRERLDDLPLLVEHFLKKLNWKFNKVVVALTEQAQGLLMNYPWPGNARELEHALEHAFILCHGDSITAEHLPVAITAYKGGQTIPTRTEKGVLSCETIEDALEKTAWKISRAANLLGVDRRTVYRKMKTFGIKRKIKK